MPSSSAKEALRRDASPWRARRDEQQRELETVLDAIRCPVRQRILLALAAGGRAHVGGLVGRTGVSQKTLSHHLGHLRTAGLVFGQRSGKCIWYEAAATRVRYQRSGDGQFSLTVAARGAGWR
jgi:DNA-binding transcriptional ArsR family regulator